MRLGSQKMSPFLPATPGGRSFTSASPNSYSVSPDSQGLDQIASSPCQSDIDSISPSITGTVGLSLSPNSLSNVILNDIDVLEGVGNGTIRQSKVLVDGQYIVTIDPQSGDPRNNGMPLTAEELVRSEPLTNDLLRMRANYPGDGLPSNGSASLVWPGEKGGGGMGSLSMKSDKLLEQVVNAGEHLTPLSKIIGGAMSDTMHI